MQKIQRNSQLEIADIRDTGLAGAGVDHRDNCVYMEGLDLESTRNFKIALLCPFMY